jgi:hypothetical protein
MREDPGQVVVEGAVAALESVAVAERPGIGAHTATNQDADGLEPVRQAGRGPEPAGDRPVPASADEIRGSAPAADVGLAAPVSRRRREVDGDDQVGRVASVIFGRVVPSLSNTVVSSVKM